MLFIDPETKTLTLSELNHLTKPYQAKVELFGSLKVGDIVDEATVLWTNAKHGLFLRLPDKLKAFASV